MALTFAVLGNGAWGTAIAVHLSQRPDYRVKLWGALPETVEEMRRLRENVPLLPGVRIPESVVLTSDPAEAVEGADCWMSAIPTAFLRASLQRFAGLASQVPIVSLSKGLENGTFYRPTEVIREVLGVQRLAVLSGPSHAEEVGRGLPAAVVAASEELELALWVQRHIGTERFRVYTNSDVVGVELCGALKNVMAIAAGLCDGLQFGDNAKAALVTRGLAEMTRFGVAHGADSHTFHGLAGLGDLIVTCYSEHSRNRRVGFRLGRGEPREAVLAGPQVAEGVWTSRSVYERVQRIGLETPIMTGVYRIVHEGQSPLDAVRDLLRRQPGNERW
ncbi:MAG: NAD(P)H-dependent glycerol-3-phosphate dehydrogenase [Thermogemmata sp.]|jgi:glycerol-3-phosphate dehydrogenase (NAD(P)+)|uniref:Glycerol-3-phosphate dehydrogenase [NAD(P)+] n=1 Tax=Thermogemmata fonticola TaxID=2755323 RepID=A0A7V8VGT5_9BACT|nr:NAD(P)H-dependent glycerol-3-phosphate dehydrogenase [Thermogemmata fonticola]MBA2227620.1 NAD(P)-dependent glycerol-3-phosphate dehydrogenase [Thermogemmata fonticola]MCX8139715.1 NAD(P)-dependent glycerol-3-phosphate dehydrogenase [Gemmataceae bacterium]GIW85329.1 MAG: glycerol-3-phosphate dehydrogenase [NAD(P)+] 1 [Gemmataceae bacterium]